MITPVATSQTGIAAIPSVALRAVPGETSAASSSTIDRFSSIVDLSGTGQLLSAVSATRNRLAALQVTPDDTSPEGLLVRAQSIVDVFNALRDNVTTLPTVAEVLPASVLGPSLSVTANDLASTALAAASARFAALGDIGIVLQALPASTATTAGLPILSVDRNALLAAGAADPAGTGALLDQAALGLSEQLSGFEAQVADTSVLRARLTQLGSTTALSIEQGAQSGADVGGLAVSRSLLQQLPADTVLNDIRRDLAVNGPNATVTAEAGVPPSAELLASTLAELAVENRSTAAQSLPTVGAVNPPAVATTDVNATPAIPLASNPAIPVVPVAPAANPSLAPAVVVANADAVTAERQASAATLALQNLLANPAMRAFDIFFDPAYSALIAAARLSDFVPRTPVIDSKMLEAEFPGPVVAAARVRAVEGRI